MQDHKND